MSDAYEKYQELVTEAGKGLGAVRIKDTSQNILLMKSAGCKVFEKLDEKCFTFNSDKVMGNTFGFSEQLVNQLMELAYDQGVKSGRGDLDEKSYAAGYERLRDSVLKVLRVDPSELDE